MEFIDLAAQQAELHPQLEQGIKRVLEHGRFINGPEIALLEEEMCRLTGAPFSVALASGTAALELVLQTLGCGPGNGVIVPSFTFAATAEAVARCGAVPVFADVDPDTALIDPESVAELLRVNSKTPDFRITGIIGVDLFGQPADYSALNRLAAEHRLFVIEDAAQSMGATDNGVPAGNLAPWAITSFFPAKPLGCYGDGGMAFCRDPGTAAKLRSLREHGRDEHDRLCYTEIGTTARLDTLQAAILLEKLRIFGRELELRNTAAARYRALLPAAVRELEQRPRTTTSRAQYTVIHPERDRLVEALQQAGIPCAVYYRQPLHTQPLYRRCGCAPLPLPGTEQLSRTVFSLPFHPYLKEADQERVAAVLSAALK